MRGVERNTCKYKRQCGILVLQDTVIWENWTKISQDFFVLFLIFSCESTIISEKSLIKKENSNMNFHKIYSEISKFIEIFSNIEN